MTRIPLSDRKCPYCGAQLDTAPTRKKKKCPSCSRYVYARRVASDWQFYLVTEDEVHPIEDEWRAEFLKVFIAIK